MLGQNNLEDYIISPIDALPTFDKINISDQDFADILNGKAIDCNPINKPTFVLHKGQIVGLTAHADDKLKLDTFLYEEGYC